MSPLLYVLALEPLLRRLRDKGTKLALRGVPFAGLLTAKVSMFTDDITAFVSRLDIKTVKKAVGEYEQISAAKVNFDKSEGLRLSVLRGRDTLGLHNIRQKVGKCSEPGRKKEGNVGVNLPSTFYPWRLRYGSFRTPPRVSRKSFFPP